MVADDPLLDEEEEGEEEEAWEQADRLLEEMRTLSSSLLQAEASIASHESVADEQKDRLHADLVSSVAAIVESVAAAPADPTADAAEATSELGGAGKVPPVAAAAAEGTTRRRVPQHRGGSASNHRASRFGSGTDTPSASILSEVSRLASKPLLPPPSNTGGAQRKPRPGIR